MAYGKPHILSAAEVKKVAALLDSLTVADLKKNYDPAAMDKADIYPMDWVNWEKDGDLPFDFLVESFKELKAFYRDAAKSGYAVIYAWG